jgi:hypothetical protein
MSAAFSIGASILGAMFGRKLLSATNMNRAASSVRRASRIARERQDVGQATETVEALQEQLAALEAEFQNETERIQFDLRPDALPLETVEIRPKKADIAVEPVVLIWFPWSREASGAFTPLR